MVRVNKNNARLWLLLSVPIAALVIVYGIFFHDSSPTAKFIDRPEPTGGSLLRLAYQASDDSWVEDMRLELRLQNRALLAGNQTIFVDLPMAAGPANRKYFMHQSNLDLSAHPWAGLAVEMRVLARDETGQQGASEGVKMVLPQRQFQNGVARAIIAQRRRLALLEQGSLKKIEQDIIVGLQLIKDKAQAYDRDSVVFLSLSVAQARLTHGRNGDKYGSVMELLWNTALRLENQAGSKTAS